MNNQELKIAFLGNQIAWGGGAKSLLLLIRALSKQNFKMYLFVTHCSSDEMKTEFEEYVEFVRLVNLPEITSAATQTIKQNRLKVSVNGLDLETTKQFADELNKLGIDILHINNSVFSPIYKTIRTRTKVKIVSHIREWIDWNGIHQKQKFIIDSIRDNSDAIICISNNEAKVFLNHQNIFIIPNPFDFHEIESVAKSSGSLKTTLGLNENCIIVGMMGRTQENKGFLDFVKAINYLKKNIEAADDIKFIILGGEIPSSFNIGRYLYRKLRNKSNYTYDIYKFLKKENLFKEVLILSNRKDILEIANLYDVAVRPSYSGDPWGRDIIEYMALKKPIVATGFSEFFIKNGDTGILVAPRDYIKMAESIHWLYKNKEARLRMGDKAYKQIFSKCNMNIFTNNILLVYDSLYKNVKIRT